MKCKICEQGCDTLDEYNTTCEACWYGMRMCPEQWLADMEAQGIEIERGMGCQPFAGGIVCGDPYKRKEREQEGE